MVLERKIVDLALGVGQHEENDERLRTPDQFDTVRNLVHDRKRGVLAKRYGYNQTPEHGSLTNITKCFATNDEVMAIRGADLWAVSEQFDQFHSRGALPRVSASTRPVFTDRAMDIVAGSASSGDATVYFYSRDMPTARQIVLRVVDPVSKKPLIDDYEIDIDSSAKMQVVFSGDEAIAIWHSDSDWYFTTLTCTQAGILNGWASTDTFTCVAGAVSYWDACVLPDGSPCIVTQRPAGGHAVCKYTSSMVLDGLFTHIDDIANAVGCCVYNNRVYWAYDDQGTGDLIGRYLDIDDWTTNGGGTISSISFQVVHIGVVGSDRGDGGVYFLWDDYDLEGAVNREALYSAMAEPDLQTVLGPSKTYRCFLGCKPFMYMDDCYAMTLFCSSDELEGTAFLQRFSSAANPLLSKGQIEATLLPRYSYEDLETLLTGWFSNEDGVFNMCLLGKDNIIYEATIDFVAMDTKWDTTTYKSSAYLSGGVPVTYDGHRVTEIVPQLWPDAVKAEAVTETGFVGPGKRYYCFTYEWKTDDGRVVESAPSEIVYLETAQGEVAECTISFLHHTLAQSSTKPITIVPYRTKDEGSVLYRVYESVTDDNLLNAHTDCVAVWQDLEVEDSDLITHRPLNLSILQNTCPPAAQTAHIHKNRLFLGCGTDLWFSRYIIEGESPCFSDQQVIDTGKEQITGLSTLGTSLLIFKANSLWRLDGEGPADDGSQSDYGDPLVVSNAVGCDDPRTICETPVGVVFGWDGGILLIDTSGQIQDIGAAMTDTLDYYTTITSVSCIPSQDAVLFTVDNGSGIGLILCWNYAVNAWSRHVVRINGLEAPVAVNPNSGCAYNSSHYFSSADYGRLFKQTIGSYFDDEDLFIQTSFVTSWFKTAGIHGAIKLRKLILLTNVQEASNVKISLGYDYESKYSHEHNWAAADIEADARYPLVHLEAFATRQRCEAFRVYVSETNTEAKTDTGEGLVYVRLTAEVAVKPGLYKLDPAFRRKGTVT